jgi:hypothetical protein
MNQLNWIQGASMDGLRRRLCDASCPADEAESIEKELKKRTDKTTALLAPSTFAADLEIVLNDLKTLLLDKNRKYGDSALTPLGCFYRGSAVNGINIRLDDKVKRLISGQQDDTEDTETDLMGYLVLKRIAIMRLGKTNGES